MAGDPIHGEPSTQNALPARAPSPGLAAVLSFFVAGLGHVYAGRLLAGAVWFCAVYAAYWLILVPGFLLHALCIWFAYQAAREFQGY